MKGNKAKIYAILSKTTTMSDEQLQRTIDYTSAKSGNVYKFSNTTRIEDHCAKVLEWIKANHFDKGP
jgi:hypothetical protein